MDLILVQTLDSVTNLFHGILVTKMKQANRFREYFNDPISKLLSIMNAWLKY